MRIGDNENAGWYVPPKHLPGNLDEQTKAYLEFKDSMEKHGYVLEVRVQDIVDLYERIRELEKRAS